jgi:phospholipase C
VPDGSVFNEEHRHTSLIATLREQWNLGEAFTGRDAVARTFSDVFTLESPRDPGTWPTPAPRPVPKFTEDALALGTVVSKLGQDLLNMVRSYAQQHGVKIDGIPDDPDQEIAPENVISVLQNSMALIFPRLAPS